ncbi:tRNA_deam_assoc, putative tRNA adenosine deaminase-associated protein [Candidatus Nanopelagicaceae bacterium]
MGDVSEQTEDFAIEAWHEDGRWSIASLPDPDDLTHIVDRLKKQQTNGGAVALIAIDDEFFLAIRVLGTHVKFFISDVTCAIDYEVAAEFLELADLDQPEEDDEPLPAGDLDIFSDLGMHSMELSTLCDDADLFPDEQIEAIANRLGFGDALTELLES